MYEWCKILSRTKFYVTLRFIYFYAIKYYIEIYIYIYTRVYTRIFASELLVCDMTPLPE